MADTKLTGLTELATTPEGTDIVYIVDDPGVTPLSKKITVVNLLNAAPATLRSLAVADLADTTPPSVLTIAETTNTLISNYKAIGADHGFSMPAAHAAGNVIFVIGDEFQVGILPNTGDFFYLNGVAMAADKLIQNTAGTLGETITGVVANINGTLRWMFYSSFANFVQETP